MKIAEIFESFHGECNGHHQGRRVTFIRTSGCNLECEYCFGVRPGRRNPKLMTSIGPNKKITTVKKGDKLITFDSSMNIVETTVQSVFEREVDKWYRITIDNVLYFVTPEHPFFTNKGLVKAKDLKVGDQILHSTPNDKISFSKLGYRNPMKEKKVATLSAKNTDYKQTGQKIAQNIKIKKEKGKLSPNSRKEMKERLKCTGRNGKDVQEIKFVDRNTYPPSLRPKSLHVYNLSCAPYNSYIIDYMWVHNCDTAYTQDSNYGQNISFGEILEQVKAFGNKYICVTGGEPLMHKESIFLLHNLWEAGYHISVETNGTIDISPFFRYVESFIVDYKLFLPDTIPRIHENYFYLRDSDVIKFLIKEETEVPHAAYIKRMFEHETKAVMAFSPIIPTMTPVTLSKLLKKHKIKNAVLSVQLHKIIGFK